jgi:hypothetical protein
MTRLEQHSFITTLVYNDTKQYISRRYNRVRLYNSYKFQNVLTTVCNIDN